jgi:hypothetical protein
MQNRNHLNIDVKDRAKERRLFGVEEYPLSDPE